MKVGVRGITPEVPQITIWIFIQYIVPEQIQVYITIEWLAFLYCSWNSLDSNSDVDPH